MHPRNCGLQTLISLIALSVTATTLLFIYSNTTLLTVDRKMVESQQGHFEGSSDLTNVRGSSRDRRPVEGIPTTPTGPPVATLAKVQESNGPVDGPGMQSLPSLPGNPIYSPRSETVAPAEATGAEPESIFQLDQTSERLLKYISTNHLTKPSTAPYNLTNPSAVSGGNGFTSVISKMLPNKIKGTFIEAGAYDGEAASNTLSLEGAGWSGILVECNPITLPKLRAKNRKAWIADVCLSVTNKPETLNFSTPIDWPASARLGQAMDLQEMKDVGIAWMPNKTWLNYQLPSFPLYSIIAATKEFTEIDFLSLDVEGAEFQVLKNYPFDLIPIKIIMLEVWTYSAEVKLEIRKFMESKGYDLTQQFSQDHIYSLKSLNVAKINRIL